VFGATFGEVINLLREEAEFVDVRITSDASPIQTTIRFVLVRNSGGPRSLQL